MLLKFVSKLSNRLKPLTVEPSSFNDPVATRTEWTPAKGGGANFRTHKLVQAGSNRMEFQPTVMTRVFSSIFILIGVGSAIPLFVASDEFLTDFPHNPAVFVMLIFVIAFGGVGLLFFFIWGKKRVFDKSYGLYYKGRTPADVPMDPMQLKGSIRLGDVHALQIISERVHSKNSSYNSYELNLVLNSGQRVNVVDHGNLEKLREDAQVLAQFLGVKLWDATALTQPLK